MYMLHLSQLIFHPIPAFLVRVAAHRQLSWSPENLAGTSLPPSPCHSDLLCTAEQSESLGLGRELHPRSFLKRIILMYSKHHGAERPQGIYLGCCIVRYVSMKGVRAIQTPVFPTPTRWSYISHVDRWSREGLRTNLKIKIVRGRLTRWSR